MKRLVPLLILVLAVGGSIWWRLQNAKAPVERLTREHPQPTAVLKPSPTAPVTTRSASDPKVAWKTELNEKLKKLPRRESLKNLPLNKIHHTPQLLTDGAKVIGDVWEQAEADPQKREETLRFMLSCAEQTETLTSLRAVCWRKLTDGITTWKLFIPLAQARVPDKIQELATQLTVE